MSLLSGWMFRSSPINAAAETQKAPEDEVRTKSLTVISRPTDNRPEYAAIARAMCQLGALDMELAESSM